MFKLPFFSSQQSEPGLGIDVGSTTVKVLSGTSHAASYLDKYSVFDTDSYTEDLVKRNLDKALEKAGLKGEEFNRVLLTLPPGIFKARTVEITVEREKQGSIGTKEKKNLMGQAQGKAKEQICSELGILETDLYFKDWVPADIRIDGYSVPELEGYNGRRMEMKLVTSFLLSDFLKLREAMEEHLDQKVELVHLAQAILKAVEREEIQDGIYLDVGGESTQLFLVRERQLKLVREIKKGGVTFSRVLEEDLGLSELRAKTLKERYSQQELSEGTTRAIREMFRKGRGYWLKEIKEVLRERQVKTLPSTFFLFGGGSKLADVQTVLKREKWVTSAFLESPRVKFLPPRALGFNSLDVQYTPLTLIINNV